MSLCQWTRDLAVGVADIDFQHKELFDKLNGLVEAMRAGNATEEVPRLLAFLGTYVQTHFATEERYMVAMSYPSTNAHRLQHQGFLRELGAVQEQFQRRGAAADLVLAVHRKVSDWLVNHICKTDKLLGAFLVKAKAQRQPAAH